jgi:phosphoglycerol transferase
MARRSLVESKQRSKPILGYLGTVAAALLILVWSLQLWRADLSIPLAYSGDSLFTQLWIKGIIENGWYLHNEQVGAPGGQDLHDFPMADNLHFATLKILAWLRPDTSFVFNVFYLLTYPLTTLSSLFVLRRLGCTFPPAVVGSLLYTFLPYHFLRGLVGHVFLAAYYLVPLVVMIALWICLDEPGEGVRRFQPSLTRGKLIGSLVICLLVASAGVYYAFFACFLMLIAGLLAAGSYRSLSPLCTAFLLVAVLSLGAIANVIPTIWYRLEHGPNPAAVQRLLAGPEVYGLKITQLLLPFSVHRLHYFANKKIAYSTAFPLGAGDFWYLGAVGVIGFGVLIGRLLFRGRRTSELTALDTLAVLNVFAVLLAVSAGFGTFISLFIGAQIRCYERMSVYIAYFALLAVTLLLDRAGRYFEQIPRAWWLYQASLGCLLLFGLWDQTSRRLAPPYALMRERFTSDARFVQALEAALPRRGMVFQLPYVPFPENPPIGRMEDYDLFKGYLHSRSLRWSYGAIKGRSGDAWLRDLASLPAERLVPALVAAGFHGVYIDRYAFSDSGAELESKLRYFLRGEARVSPDGRLSFFSLPTQGGPDVALRP